VNKPEEPGNELIVSVTYGFRWHLLRESLDAAFREGCKAAVVVVNGPSDVREAAVIERFGSNVQLVWLTENTGSANGFAVGIETATHLASSFIILLDDDNKLEEGTLKKLRDAYAKFSKSISQDDLVVAGFRSAHQFHLTTGRKDNKYKLSKNCFLGLHVIQIPRKIWRRIRKSKIEQIRYPSYADCDVAPYGGMYFHRSLPLKHGVGDRRLVLYGDDVEYSYRITRRGGKIMVVTDALLLDIEPSWNTRSKFALGIAALLVGESDSRAYYNCRNYIYFEQHYARTDRVVRWVNRSICLTLMWLLMVKYGAHSRYQVLQRAIRDGEAGCLGLNADFPLPGPGSK
jgi:GT2 family glycosyltransferase